MFQDIDEIPYNFCGVIQKRYVLWAPVDDPIERAYMNFHVFDDNSKEEKRQLYYGSEGEQQEERDPLYGGHAFCIIQYDAFPLSSLTMLSPERVIPAPLALMVGVGCIRALAALNRAGYVNRFVTPYNFAVTNPPTRENILHGIIITDLSAALPWPLKPRVFVPFIGTYRYSSVRAHWGREQGPSDDIISVIFMVAEWLHGKLPWRSLGFDEDRICFIKTYFYKTKAFKKLPREIRGVYKKMYEVACTTAIDFKWVIGEFGKALNKRDPNGEYQIPSWLLIEQTDE